LGKEASEKYTILDYNKARDDEVAVALPGPYADLSQ